MSITVIVGSSDLCFASPGVKLNYHREKTEVKTIGDGFLWGAVIVKYFLITLALQLAQKLQETPY